MKRWQIASVALLAVVIGATVWFSTRAEAQEQAEGVVVEPGTAAAPASGKALTTKDVSSVQAEMVMRAAKAKASDMGLRMDIAIVDAGGNLKAFHRMDGAWIGSIDIAIKKAKTARYFNMPTGDIGKLSQPGKSLYQIEVSNQGLITFPGGVPLKLPDGSIIGAIGVSGSTVENDHAVAAAGAAIVD
jgi:uncharacterized protein GlcG (DUF336 family)